MTSWTLARRSFSYYLRSHVGTVFGAAIATAVLTGALLVGDSVRGSLRGMALARIGQADLAMASGDRLFREALAADLAVELPQCKIAAVLQLPGTAGSPDGAARANQVQITGVSENFWKLANQTPSATLASNEVWLNQRLAGQLRAKPGDTILLRVPRVSHLSRDAPLSPEEDSTVSLRLEVAKIVSDEQFGRFSLAASQVPPFNAFLSLKLLQSRVNATNQANLLLTTAAGTTLEQQQLALRKVFLPQDAQVQLLAQTNFVEARSPRVFLDTPISAAAMAAHPQAQPVFTYFVNGLRHGERATPYSMVTAAPHLTPADLRDDEIVINQWLAEDLSAKVGDSFAVRYFIMGLMRDLIEKTNTFRVRAIVPMEMPYADPTLMPDFPGMTDADNCRDWDTGFPIDTDAIRDKDEAYWDQYRGSPKAFVTMRAAQTMWSNRFGNLTSVRYPPGPPIPLMLHLQPEQLGFVFMPIRDFALAASNGAQDFGGLFAGFSMFLIAAALMLTSLLFRFALDQRSGEMGTLLAIGLRPRQVSRMLLLEGALLSALGGLLGLAFAALYAKAMVYGLSTVWSEAVAGSAIAYHGQPATYAIGFLSSVFIAIGTIAWTLRRERKRTARELLSEGFEHEAITNAPTGKPFALGLLLLAAGAGIALLGLLQGERARADLFFGAGALVLIAGLVLASALIRRLSHSQLAEKLSLTGMGLRSIVRRRKRSRAAIALLACGAFLIASIGAFRLEAGRKATERSSGTGGFALIGEATIPVVHNLNAKAGRDFYGLAESQLASVSFVPFRVLEGEDASCLNLNRAQRPRLLGVNPAQLADRKAFTFGKTIEPADNPWLLLQKDFGPNVVPAIGDAASIQWALGKKIGDTLRYIDATGREFEIRIVGAVANSILQGNLVIAEEQFVRRYPNEAGYRMFLIDAPSNAANKSASDLAATLSRALRDNGLEVTSAQDRLAAFNAVQNTYLGTFQLLGGLGLLLGTFGLGVILLRNVFERRGELALLKAVGFRNSSLRWMIVSEHAALLLLGLLVGVMAAAIAVLPAILGRGTELPAAQLGLTLGAILLCGLIWTALAAAKSLRAPLLENLRNE